MTITPQGITITGSTSGGTGTTSTTITSSGINTPGLTTPNISTSGITVGGTITWSGGSGHSGHGVTITPQGMSITSSGSTIIISNSGILNNTRFLGNTGGTITINDYFIIINGNGSPTWTLPNSPNNGKEFLFRRNDTNIGTCTIQTSGSDEILELNTGTVSTSITLINGESKKVIYHDAIWYEVI